MFIVWSLQRPCAYRMGGLLPEQYLIKLSSAPPKGGGMTDGPRPINISPLWGDHPGRLTDLSSRLRKTYHRNKKFAFHTRGQKACGICASSANSYALVPLRDR